MQMQTISVEINEAAEAFRVNGVTVAKRHLRNTFPSTEGDEKRLAKYLTIVPFLHQAFTLDGKKTSESVKYGAIKAHRIYDALGLTEPAIVPFMIMCLAQAGEDISVLTRQGPGRAFVHATEHFTGEQPEESNVVNLADHLRGRTLH